MKKLNLILMTALMFVSLACTKDENNEPNGRSADQIAQTAKTGSWEITYFFDSGKVETNNFSGYVFSFNDNGSVVADNGTTAINGTWSVSDISSSSSSSSSDPDFNIFFQVSPDHDFDDLNDDWDIITVSNNVIELVDVSGGNGGTDYLTFRKM